MTFHDLNYKKQSEAIDTFFKKNKLKLAISSTARGIGGCILERAQENNVKALCIPHGTLSSGFDEKDKLYKKIISRAIIPDSNLKFVYIYIGTNLLNYGTHPYMARLIIIF